MKEVAKLLILQRQRLHASTNYYNICKFCQKNNLPIFGSPQSISKPAHHGYVQVKSISTSLVTKSRDNKEMKLTSSQAPMDSQHDWIGPPDTNSNMPPIRFHIPEDETPTERKYRLQRMKINEWNHNFWAEHNAKFFKGKEQFIQERLSKQGKLSSKKKSLSPEELSIFYRNFLNENRSSHLEYNRQWYKANLSMLWPAVRVAATRLRRRLTGRAGR